MFEQIKAVIAAAAPLLPGGPQAVAAVEAIVGLVREIVPSLPADHQAEVLSDIEVLANMDTAIDQAIADLKGN